MELNIAPHSQRSVHNRWQIFPLHPGLPEQVCPFLQSLKHYVAGCYHAVQKQLYVNAARAQKNLAIASAGKHGRHFLAFVLNCCRRTMKIGGLLDLWLD